MHTNRPPSSVPEASATLPAWLHVSDIQGLAQLATEATLGVTGLAETLHGQVYKAVAAPFGAAGQALLDRQAGSTGIRKHGITGLVYAGIRGITRLAGGTADAVLSRLASRAGGKAPSAQREAMLAALNGVLGDHLVDSANPLAIRMSLRQQGQPLVLEKTALAQRLPGATGKILVLVHGLCMNDLQWRADRPAGAPGYGEQLARELGYTPLYLHYNTGLHISDNGQQLAALLEQLVLAWPRPVQELALLTHSMGGLVARSACHSAAAAGQHWLGLLRHLVFLGTPHHGAPLEQAGHWVDRALGSNVVTRPFASIGQVRSAGITDLRHGRVLPLDWQGVDRLGAAAETRPPVPLPAGVACFAVAATLAPVRKRLHPRQVPARVLEETLGDGLVPLPSALGRHADPARCLAFEPEHQWVAGETGHLALLHSPLVYARLRRWLA